MSPVSLRLTMERLSSQITRQVGKHWGEAFPFYYVMEYPKSGGSWLADMIADYLQIPRPVMPVLPIGFPAVLHGHWSYSPKYRRVFYLHRDGRDVVVSSYFRILQEIRDPPYASSPAYYRRRFPSLFDPDADVDDARTALPGFIAEWATRPAATRLSWSRHIDQWAFDRPNVVTLSYEELLRDAVATLARVIPVHTGKPVDRERLEATVHKYSFEQQTGRERGAEVRGAIIRKGVAGDWRNHFTRKAGEVFDRHCGETLVRLGYADDRGWYAALPDA